MMQGEQKEDQGEDLIATLYVGHHLGVYGMQGEQEHCAPRCPWMVGKNKATQETEQDDATDREQQHVPEVMHPRLHPEEGYFQRVCYER